MNPELTKHSDDNRANKTDAGNGSKASMADIAYARQILQKAACTALTFDPIMLPIQSVHGLRISRCIIASAFGSPVIVSWAGSQSSFLPVRALMSIR